MVVSRHLKQHLTAIRIHQLDIALPISVRGASPVVETFTVPDPLSLVNVHLDEELFIVTCSGERLLEPVKLSCFLVLLRLHALRVELEAVEGE